MAFHNRRLPSKDDPAILLAASRYIEFYNGRLSL
jgi:hypothetical protein